MPIYAPDLSRAKYLLYSDCGIRTTSSFVLGLERLKRDFDGGELVLGMVMWMEVMIILSDDASPSWAAAVVSVTTGGDLMRWTPL